MWPAKALVRANSRRRGFVIQALRPGVNRRPARWNWYGARVSRCRRCSWNSHSIRCPRKSERRGDVGEWPPGSGRAVADGGVSAVLGSHAAGFTGGRPCPIVGTVQQVGSLVADVVHFQRGVPGQFTLHRQGPLLDVRVLWELRDDHGKELTSIQLPASPGASGTGGNMLSVNLGRVASTLDSAKPALRRDRYHRNRQFREFRRNRRRCRIHHGLPSYRQADRQTRTAARTASSSREPDCCGRNTGRIRSRQGRWGRPVRNDAGGTKAFVGIAETTGSDWHGQTRTSCCPARVGTAR